MSVAAIAGVVMMATGAEGQVSRVYIGTYTGESSRGIYCFEFDAATGKATDPQLAAEVKNPSFLAVSPDRRHIYAVSEISEFQGKRRGGVSSFAIDATTGALTLLNQQGSGGVGPAHVAVSPDGKHVAVANYGSGSIALLAVEADAKLTSSTSVIQHEGSSVNPKRQKEPHAHSVNFDPSSRFLFAADLGIDKVMIYKVDMERQALNDPPFAALKPGHGPRHLAFHPGGKYIYVINEMGNTITVFVYDAQRGAMTEVQDVSTLPEGFTETNHTAEVRVHPSGKFVYGSNRGHNSIVIFTVDESTGKLTEAGHESTGGKTPRNFALDPTGGWLLAANQDTDNIVIFRVDQETGGLKRIGEITGIDKPVCVLFVPLQ